MSAPVSGYVVAFDFGLRFIGVAIGQTVTQSAAGIGTVSARAGKPDWLKIEKLVGAYQPKLAVVGLPLNMDGSESDMATHARRFADQLAHRLTLDVVLHDERLTTKAARAAMQDAKNLGQASTEHELAACLILQSWLSEQS